MFKGIGNYNRGITPISLSPTEKIFYSDLFSRSMEQKELYNIFPNP